MKVINLKKKTINYLNFVKRGAKETDYDELITEPCIGILDGEIMFIYDYIEFPTNHIVEALKRIKYSETTRADGLVTNSRVFGYKPRVTMRADYCSVASLATDFPDENIIITNLAKEIQEKYIKNNPEMYEHHAEVIKDKIKDSYRIEGTVFTSGIINKNNKLNYHFDAGNFKKVYSCMPVFKRGIKGGYLALPEYGIGLELKNNSILMFDGQGILHGVTPIERESETGYRFSVVYYSLMQMWKCLDVDEELARIKNVRTQREKDRLDLPPEKLETIMNTIKSRAKDNNKRLNNKE